MSVSLGLQHECDFKDVNRSNIMVSWRGIDEPIKI